MNKRVLVLLSSPIASRTAGVSRYAREHGWHLMFQDRMGFAHPFDWMGDGVIATIRREPRSLAYLRHLSALGVPIVDLTWDVPEFPCARVCADHVAAGRLAAAHLAERNYRSRAFFSLDWGNNVQRRLWNGFTEAAPADRWVFAEKRPRVRWDDWGAVGRWLAGKFAAAGKPLGILAYSQGEAVRLLDAAQSLGIGVPDELGVVSGNDDPILLESQPVPVSAVDTDLERGAYEGAGLLDRLMSGEPLPAAPTVLPPRGVVARRSTDATVAADPLVREALRRIGEHLAGSFGPAQLAESVGVSRGTLDRRFTAELGRSTSAEIRRRRLALARRLLRETDLPIAEIAARTGFSSASHLGAAIREETGLTPRELRKSDSFYVKI